MSRSSDAAAPHAPAPYLRAAMLMLGGMIFFAMMAVTIRLASQQLGTWEIAFFRNFFGLLALLPLLRGQLHASLRTTQLPRYALRSLIGVASMFCGFWSLTHLPLAQAVSLSYSTPLFVTIAAAVLLGETVRLRRWSAVTIGFIGVLVIMRPGSSQFSAGTLVALAAAILGGIVAIQIKQLSKADPPDTIVLWTYLFWVPITLLPALPDWVWPQGWTWLWAALIGVLGTGGQLLWTRALKLGEVSALTPISFIQLAVVAVAAWLLFDEPINAHTIAGSAIIVAANAYIAYREARLAEPATARPGGIPPAR